MQGEQTYTPRLIALDLPGSLKSLKPEGTLYDTHTGTKDVPAWYDNNIIMLLVLITIVGEVVGWLLCMHLMLINALTLYHFDPMGLLFMRKLVTFPYKGIVDFIPSHSPTLSWKFYTMSCRSLIDRVHFISLYCLCRSSVSMKSSKSIGCTLWSGLLHVQCTYTCTYIVLIVVGILLN